MKKTKNKLLSIIPTATAAIAPAGALLNQNTENAEENIENDVQNVTQNKYNLTSINKISNLDQNISFNGKQYPSIDDVVKDFLSKEGVVTNKTFIGDVKNATSVNEYNTIDILKLADPQQGRLENVYKTLGGEYTSDLEKAKRSYLQTPIVKWTDNKGNYYDSEMEAISATMGNDNRSTSSVAYYEITDYSEQMILEDQLKWR